MDNKETTRTTASMFFMAALENEKGPPGIITRWASRLNRSYAA
jgi:hypothetical protein